MGLVAGKGVLENTPDESTTRFPNGRILRRLEFEGEAEVKEPGGAPGTPHSALPFFTMGTAHSQSHLPLSARPAFHTQNGFLFVVGEAAVRFAYWILSVVGG